MDENAADDKTEIPGLSFGTNEDTLVFACLIIAIVIQVLQHGHGAVRALRCTVVGEMTTSLPLRRMMKCRHERVAESMTEALSLFLLLFSLKCIIDRLRKIEAAASFNTRQMAVVVACYAAFVIFDNLGAKIKHPLKHWWYEFSMFAISLIIVMSSTAHLSSILYDLFLPRFVLSFAKQTIWHSLLWNCITFFFGLLNAMLVDDCNGCYEGKLVQLVETELTRIFVMMTCVLVLKHNCIMELRSNVESEQGNLAARTLMLALCDAACELDGELKIVNHDGRLGSILASVADRQEPVDNACLPTIMFAAAAAEGEESAAAAASAEQQVSTSLLQLDDEVLTQNIDLASDAPPDIRCIRLPPICVVGGASAEVFHVRFATTSVPNVLLGLRWCPNESGGRPGPADTTEEMLRPPEEASALIDALTSRVFEVSRGFVLRFGFLGRGASLSDWIGQRDNRTFQRKFHREVSKLMSDPDALESTFSGTLKLPALGPTEGDTAVCEVTLTCVEEEGGELGLIARIVFGDAQMACVDSQSAGSSKSSRSESVDSSKYGTPSHVKPTGCFGSSRSDRGISQTLNAGNDSIRDNKRSHRRASDLLANQQLLGQQQQQQQLGLQGNEGHDDDKQQKRQDRQLRQQGLEQDGLSPGNTAAIDSDTNNTHDEGVQLQIIKEL